jgi:hypothetical protein
MAVRKSPVRSRACLAANRAYAQKVSGPSTAEGKARVASNPLKHGDRTESLPKKFLRVGDGDGEAPYRWFQAEITATFGTGRPREQPRADQNSSGGVVPSQGCGGLGTKPERPLVSWELWPDTSIKDSDCGLAFDRPRVLGNTASAAHSGGN